MLVERNTYTPRSTPIDKNIGKIFGRLTLVSFVEKKGNHKYYSCLCVCGVAKTICYTHLVGNKIFSCGCLKHELDITKGEPDSAAKSLYRHYKQNAKQRNLIFDITYDDFLRITALNCFYCGSFPIKEYCVGKRGKYTYTGIDRKDSAKGYVTDNIVPCCADCNYFKSNIPYDKFLDLVEKIYKFKFGGV
jgi:hypothetical protein